MKTILTPDAISYLRDNVRTSLVPSYPVLDKHLPTKFNPSPRGMHLNKFRLYYHLDPSLWSFRKKLEDMLERFLRVEEGTNEDFIYYNARCEDNIIKIKALPNKVRSIRGLHNLKSLVEPLKQEGSVSPGLQLATAIMDITFLKCLFSLGKAVTLTQGIDLSKAALPDDDVRVRVGEYNLLYDTIDKEWALWTKSLITK